MAVRIQLRRDTAANWVSNNPVLRDGELGIETDTLKIKIGNGSAWNSISNYANVVPSDLNTTLGDYVTVNDIGAQGGVVGLNNSYNAIIPGSSIIIEGPTADSYETTLTVTDPTADRTITLPDRDGTVITTGDTGTVTNAMLAGSIANNKLTNSSVTINGYEIALGASASYGTDNISEGTTNKYFTDERAQDAVGNNLAAGLSYNDVAGTIGIDSTVTTNSGTQTLTNKTIALGSNTVSGTLAQFNTAVTDADLASLAGTQTLTNKTISLANNTITGTKSQFNAAMTDADFATLSGTETFSGKTIPLAINNINGTLADFNTALTDADFVSLAGPESLTNKTLVSPTININGLGSLLSAKTSAQLGGNYGRMGDNLNIYPTPIWTDLQTATLLVITGAGNSNGTYSKVSSDAVGFSNWYIATNPLFTYSDLSSATFSLYTTATTVISSTEISYLDGVTSAIQTQIDAKAPINNPTFTGTVTLAGAPSSANEAATKAYVDNITAGLNFHSAVHAATTANLSATYNNGAGTLSASGAFPTIDGETIVETERVLVKSQSDAKQNGIYVLTDDGDPSGTWVLTRASDADNSPAGEIAYGDFVFVQSGSTNGGYGFIMTTTGTITLGTSNINWTQFNAGQTVVAGNGLTESTPGTLAINTGVTVDLNTAQTLTNKTITGTFTGNLTGNADTVTNGVVTTGSYSDPAWITSLAKSKVGLGNVENTALSTWAGSANITTLGTITTGTWTGTTIAIANGGTGATDAGTARTNLGLAIGTDVQAYNSTLAAVAGGTYTGDDSIATVGTITAGTWSGTTIATTKGGTGLTSYATGDILYASASNTLAKLAAGTNGQILTLAAGVPTWAAAPAGYSAPTIGSTSIASGATVTQINGLVLGATSTTTVNSNTATTIDTNALSGFTTVKYLVSIKQGSKIRSSQIIAQTDGTSVDYTEFGITETGGTMTGILAAVSVSSTNAVLQVTITNAATTNATVKINKVLI